MSALGTRWEKLEDLRRAAQAKRIQCDRLAKVNPEQARELAEAEQRERRSLRNCLVIFFRHFFKHFFSKSIKI